MAGSHTEPDMIGGWDSTDDDRDTVAQLEAEAKKYAAQLAALRRDEQAAASAQAVVAAAGSLVTADKAALAEENARLKEQLAAMSSASAHRSTVKRAREEEEAAALLKRYTAENEKLAAALASGSGLSKLTVARPSAAVIAASHARSASLTNSITRSSVKTSGMRSVIRDLETREKGVDICIMMDGTGSMGWCLGACKTKANEIMAAAGTVHPEAVTRVACVIYRDIDDGPKLTEVSDFMTKQGLDAMTSFLSGVRATGGADECESIASGLKAALKLSWRSSTKLLIQFGDAPAHGTMYHNGQSGDSHPGGDPTGMYTPCAGLVPEKLVKQLCSNRVNYYFAQINTTTIHMTNLFAEEYKHSQNAVFKVLDRGATASTFIPIVVDSVRDSMRRSAFFASGKTASSSGRGAGKGDPRTIFHSVL